MLVHIIVNVCSIQHSGSMDSTVHKSCRLLIERMSTITEICSLEPLWKSRTRVKLLISKNKIHINHKGHCDNVVN